MNDIKKVHVIMSLLTSIETRHDLSEINMFQKNTFICLFNLVTNQSFFFGHCVQWQRSNWL